MILTGPDTGKELGRRVSHQVLSSLMWESQDRMRMRLRKITLKFLVSGRNAFVFKRKEKMKPQLHDQKFSSHFENCSSAFHTARSVGLRTESDLELIP